MPRFEKVPRRRGAVVPLASIAALGTHRAGARSVDNERRVAGCTVLPLPRQYRQSSVGESGLRFARARYRIETQRSDERTCAHTAAVEVLAMQRLGKLVHHLAVAPPSQQQPPLAFAGSSSATNGPLGVSRILFQGDSITDAGRSRETTVEQPIQALGTGYAQMAAALLLSDRPEEDLKIYNRGVGGDRIVNL